LNYEKTYFYVLNLNKVYTVNEAQKKMENFCAYQERCHKEVRAKLMSMNMIPQVIDTIMVHLIEQNYLNEERFAMTFVRGKFRIKKWGKNRLKRELKFRNISNYSITKAINQIGEREYLKTLDEIVIKRVNQVKESNKYKKRKKVVDYLLYRGWESHLIYEKLNEYV